MKSIFSAEKKAVRAYRRYSWIYKNFSKGLGYYLYNRAKLKYSVDIAPTAVIGDGFVIVHLGAIVIGRNCVIGNNVSIQSGVTLGMKNTSDTSMPIIKDGVYLGTGAKVLGGVTIGQNSIVGANSVVTKNVDENEVVYGVPGIIRKHVNAAQI